MVDVATFGGLFIIMGAYYTLEGDIYKSLIVYLLADGIWIMLGFQSKDYFGTVLIAIGALMSFIAFLKIYSGEYRKGIRYD